jgi:hypothetical protein
MRDCVRHYGDRLRSPAALRARRRDLRVESRIAPHHDGSGKMDVLSVNLAVMHRVASPLWKLVVVVLELLVHHDVALGDTEQRPIRATVGSAAYVDIRLADRLHVRAKDLRPGSAFLPLRACKW